MNFNAAIDAFFVLIPAVIGLYLAFNLKRQMRRDRKRIEAAWRGRRSDD